MLLKMACYASVAFENSSLSKKRVTHQEASLKNLMRIRAKPTQRFVYTDGIPAHLPRDYIDQLESSGVLFTIKFSTF